jgi:uncharacterized protein YdeI (YjbR/CyaY-like superfamily)
MKSIKYENQISFTNRKEFRNWLLKNHSSNDPIWIEFYKDGRKGITYNESLEEALCFGWIDSRVKRVDDKIYLYRFSKRSDNSKWSVRNKEIVKELIRNGLMTDWGLDSIEAAKKSGNWNLPSNDKKSEDISGFKIILKKHDKIIYEKFINLGEASKKLYSRYYFDAKKELTKKNRLEKIIKVIEGKIKLI